MKMKLKMSAIKSLEQLIYDLYKGKNYLRRKRRSFKIASRLKNYSRFRKSHWSLSILTKSP